MLIGLYGDSRCGKDTVAEILVRKHGFSQRVMADPIREILLRIDPLVEDIVAARPLSSVVNRYGWDEVKKLYPESVDYMINLGQAARDIIAPDVWLAPVMRNLDERTVISDIRQPNEYDAIRYYGGQVWKIVREGTVPRGMDRLLEDREFDAVIYNNSTIDELKAQVERLINDPEAHSKDGTPRAEVLGRIFRADKDGLQRRTEI